MAKISPKDPGLFELPEAGTYLFRGKRAEHNPPQTPEQGWLFKVWLTFEGGEYDGMQHYESFWTRSQFGDGLDGCRHLLKMLNAMGRIPDAVAADFDSDKFETDAFAGKFESMVVDSLVLGELAHYTEKKKGAEGRKRAKIVKYSSPKTAKAPEKKPVKSEKEFDF